MFSKLTIGMVLIFGITLISSIGISNNASAEIVLRLGHSNEAVSPTHVVSVKWADLISERSKREGNYESIPAGSIGERNPW